MPLKFEPRNILHVEDDLDFRRSFFMLVELDEQINKLLGIPPVYVQSSIAYELEEAALEEEIRRIEREIEGRASFLGITSGQVARTFLQTHLPVAIISDTAFPINGQKIVEWLLSHGLSNYPLIGYSSTPFNSVTDTMKSFFGQTNARYFQKGVASPNDVTTQLAFNINYNLQNNSSN